jgi:hypothetical protein
MQLLLKANFHPNQPRVPRGNPDGGQWTSTGGGSGRTRLAQMPRGGRRIGSDAEGTPEQEARLVAEEAQAQEAIRRVREIDPNWSPQESLTDPNSIEGQIATARGKREEAEDRLIELARQEPQSVMDTFRRQHGLDLTGEPAWSRKRNTVALCRVGDQPFLGVNSGATGEYTFRDLLDATRLRTSLIEKYPHIMNTENIGQFPNASVFHAEVTCLLRAARGHGGSLTGKTVEMHVDRAMCGSCEVLLPYVGLELGNPTIITTDDDGVVTTIRDGKLIR